MKLSDLTDKELNKALRTARNQAELEKAREIQEELERRKKEKSAKKASPGATMLGLVLVVAAMWGCTKLINIGSSKCSPQLAVVHAEKAVKRKLRDPGSYSKVGHDVLTLSNSSCLYRVNIAYKANNGFGGLTDGVASVELETRRDGSKIKSVVVN